VVIEKPHRGGFIPVMHQGFDLAYTPLMEELIGSGMILYCQLDVTGRTGESPVIEQVTKNIIEYADKYAGGNKSKIVYAGASHGSDIIDLTGVDYAVAGDLDNLSKDTILVLGNGAEMIPGKKLRGYLAKGGKIFLLAVNNPARFAKKMGVDLKEHKMEGYWFDYKDKDSITRGMCAGDFYWKDNFKLPLPEEQFPLHVRKAGEGQLLVCQVDPLYFSDDDMHQRRYRGRYKMTRLLSIIFTNLGASFKDTSIKNLKDRELGSPPLKNINLAGDWKFRIDINDKGLEEGWQKEEWTKEYKTMGVPGSWELQGENTPNPNVDGKQPYDGYAWYQKTFVIPSSAKSITLYSEMGAVDDLDWTYFNGELIGKTGKETPNYWDAKRYYKIPGDLIKYDSPNTITVRVFDSYQAGGIMKEPVQVSCEKAESFFYPDSDNYGLGKRFDPYAYYRW
jgi:hypothetical protein